MNKKILITFTAICILAIIFIAYSKLHQAQILQATKKQEAVKSASDTTQLQQYYASYQDPYVIALRAAFNGYLDGSGNGIDDPKVIIQQSTRDGYIDGLASFDDSYYKSKFVVVYITKSEYGGKIIDIVFQDKPDKLFQAWVYLLGTGKYDLRGFSQVLSFTPEKMKELNKHYSTFMADKVHAL